MSKIEVNTVEPQCGTTLTLGASGDTVTLGSGASQSGFGRTGTVDWQTTKKTATFTAVNGEGYFVDTSGGAVTMNLPSSPSAGNIVAVKDYSGDFATNNLTIGRGGSPINGANSEDVVIKTAGASIFLVYVDASQGWVATQDDASTFSGESFITATGGTITTCGNDKIHTFTSPGTFTVCSVATCAANNLVSYLVVAGGGAAAGIGSNNSSMGGGGAGGFRELKSPSTPGYTASPLDGYPNAPNRITVTATGFPITVGGGGSGGGPGLGNMGTNGSVSTFSTISSAGGGYGAGYDSSWGPGNTGGSGGGGVFNVNGSAGNTPPTTPPQGNPGGNGLSTPGKCGSAGGGGAGAAGTSPPGSCHGVVGGIGAVTGINPSTCVGTPGPAAGRYFAGGGSGAPFQQPPSIPGTSGGGGGNTNGPSGGAGENGTANTGGGAGGTNSAPGSNFGGASGGSGIVIIRYKFQ